MVDRIPSHGSRLSVPVHQPKRNYGKSDPRSARPWRRLRDDVFVRDNYTCQSVGPDGRKCGRVGTDMEVDHIKPRSQGGKDEMENLQTLCELCHAMKTSTEASSRSASMCPEWMPATTKRMVVVCGRPACGKTTYISKLKGQNDLVIDLEKMAWEMRRKLEDMSKQELFSLIRLRNNKIAKFARSETPHEICWILTTAGRPYQREFWQKRGAEVVVVDTPVDVCQRRINDEDCSTQRKKSRLQAAQDWN